MNIAVIVYASLCLAVALYGRKSRIGFWGVLLFSALMTPVLLFYGLIGLRPAEVVPKPPKISAKRRALFGTAKV
jgi:hypothetical protein